MNDRLIIEVKTADGDTLRVSMSNDDSYDVVKNSMEIARCTDCDDAIEIFHRHLSEIMDGIVERHMGG